MTQAVALLGGGVRGACTCCSAVEYLGGAAGRVGTAAPRGAAVPTLHPGPQDPLQARCDVFRAP
jgi:hypothetical protein